MTLRKTPRVPQSIGVALVALGGAGFANAGCSNTSPNASPQPSAPKSTAAAVNWISAVYRPAADAGPRFLPVHDGDEHDPIVGLWKFEMLSKSTPSNTNPMPDGTLIDFGTAAWHSDGTELMNSGIRNPADGDFCQGVWDQVGPQTFVLNHYALAYTNGVYTGPANIRERVTVDDSGRHYSGSFTLVQYLATPTIGHEFDQSQRLVTITGTIAATRVTATN